MKFSEERIQNAHARLKDLADGQTIWTLVRRQGKVYRVHCFVIEHGFGDGANISNITNPVAIVCGLRLTDDHEIVVSPDPGMEVGAAVVWELRRALGKTFEHARL